MDFFFAKLSLLFADMLVAISGILNLRWINEKQTLCGTFCSAQGDIYDFFRPEQIREYQFLS